MYTVSKSLWYDHGTKRSMLLSIFATKHTNSCLVNLGTCISINCFQKRQIPEYRFQQCLIHPISSFGTAFQVYQWNSRKYRIVWIYIVSLSFALAQCANQHMTTPEYRPPHYHIVHFRISITFNVFKFLHLLNYWSQSSPSRTSFRLWIVFYRPLWNWLSWFCNYSSVSATITMIPAHDKE